MKRKMNNGGFSLVELAIGLAVVTVLVLAISMSSGIRDNARVQSATESVQALRSAAENYLVSTGKLNFIGVDVNTLKTNNLLPINFTATASNPWGGDFTVAANSVNNTKIDIALTSVAQSEGNKLVTYFNNIANGTIYDATKKTWTVTF